MMTKKYLCITILAASLLMSCNQETKQETTLDKAVDSKSENINNLLVGSWVQPNPINGQEVQGFTLKNDGTAESINMATLVYREWWAEEGKLSLVAESIGNDVSFVDTTEYEIVKNTDVALVLKRGNLIESYTRKEHIETK